MKKVPMRMCVACREMRAEACFNKAAKTRALERALEHPLSEEAAAYLRQVIFCGGNEAL